MHASKRYEPLPAAAPAARPAMLVILVLLASALGILWIGQATDLDLRLADVFFDRASATFPLQHAWFAEDFNHGILKLILTAGAVGTVLLALYDGWRPFKNWEGARRRGLRVTAMSAVMVPLVTSLLKRASASHCPWDLARYGGSAPYIRILDWLPPGISSGHCLPGGHASSALWLVALSAFWWPRRPRRALAVGAAMLAFGFCVGGVQQLRGAHFLTHTLWSCWIACAVVFLIYEFDSRVLAKLPAFGYSSVPRNAALTSAAE